MKIKILSTIRKGVNYLLNKSRYSFPRFPLLCTFNLRPLSLTNRKTVIDKNLFYEATQVRFTCSKSKKETLKKGVKYVQSEQ